MKNMKRLCIILSLVLVLCSLFSLTVFAAEPGASTEDSGKLDMNLKPESFEERFEYALQGTATGMLMVFSVLGLLTLILYGSKYVFYDLPNKKLEKKRAAMEKRAEVLTAKTDEEQSDAYEQEDDGELIAVITAAVAAMLESEDYKNEFAGGFRVVSFKRTTKGGAWNKQ